MQTTLVFTFEDGSEALAHYGVKGMKWGVRSAESIARLARAGSKMSRGKKIGLGIGAAAIVALASAVTLGGISSATLATGATVLSSALGEGSSAQIGLALASGAAEAVGRSAADKAITRYSSRKNKDNAKRRNANAS